MFERYLTDALTTHFGHVVENLDSDKVRLSAWSGELVLEDLSLRPTALDSFVADCPVEIAYGKVGHLELSIPWKLFGSPKLRRGDQEESSRCSVVLSDVNILITPRRETKRQTPENDDEDLESSDTPEERRLKKEKKVQSLLDANLLQRVAKSSLSSSRWKWAQDWLAGLLSTLSVTVKNIHIRYEDPGTSMGFVWSSSNGGEDSTIRRYRPSFAVGITLREFSALTSGTQQPQEDGDGKPDGKEPAPQQPSQLAPGEDFVVRHKVAAADKLAIYWDSDCQLISLYVDQTKGRTLQSAHYQSSFGLLNDANNYQLHHSYVLDPISPEVKLALVSKAASPKELEAAESSDSENSTNDSVSPPTHSPMAPPSTVTISLPPCKLTIARNTLEDTAYIRKSLSVWKHATEGLLSESSLRRLARLRPLKSAREDPQRWWIYSSEATLAMLRVNRDGRDLGQLEFYRKRKRGWLGLAQALGRRRRYVELYKQMVYAETEDARVESHAALLEMEDDLLEEEIVAFRIALYESLKKDDAVHDALSPKSNSNGKSRWKGWMPNSIGGSSDGDVMGEKSDEVILTHAHRRRMVDEMIVALDQEKTNIEKRVRAGVRQASVLRLDPASLAYDEDEDEFNPAIMKTTLLCQEFALQVNDQSTEQRHRSGIPTFSSNASKPTPVVKLSCAWTQEQAWYEDGSWTADCSIASLVAKDLIASNSHGSKHSVMRTYFPNLIGRKRGLDIVDEKDAVIIDGQSYHRSVTIVVSRRLHWQLPDGRPIHSAVDRGSTTRTQIRISPMEVVYSTLPAEALSRVLATVKTPELADDYHRMASAAYEWQERQKMKFLRALAHKHKKIVVDVDVGAPELLIPEDLNRRESPMVAVDLGRLQIFNGEHSKGQSSMYDDQWGLIMSNMQVQCTTIAAYAKSNRNIYERDLENRETTNDTPPKLVEPFSLEFTISTKIVSDVERASDDMTRVHVLATLPRLTFNLTSSAMHLVMRLQQQWKRRKLELRDDSMPAGFNSSVSRATNFQSSLENRRRRSMVQSSGDDSTIPGDAPDKRISRTMQLQFSAPVITLRLENDVDGRDCDVPIDAKQKLKFRRRTPLVDLSFRGIRGAIVQQVSVNGITTTKFDARLHSLGAVDLYQSAGIDYALLMSSVSPETMPPRLSTDAGSCWKIQLSEDDIDGLVDQETATDLVMVEFTSINAVKGAKSGTEQSITHADKLAIQFHELYIEWNPETLAAIQKAIRMPEKVETYENEAEDAAKLRCESIDLSDDTFFDALEEEDEFFDAGSETDSVVHLISEIPIPSANLTDLDRGASSTSANEPLFCYSNGLKLGRESEMVHSFEPSISPHTHLPSQRKNEIVQEPRPYKPFEFEFKLSKLRVSFNKETRHRKVMIAQMDGTSVKYATQPAGGSRTKMSIGNLVFTDPASSQNGTLYGQILGLKSDAFAQTASRASSLLEMEIVLNPKTREFITVTPTGAEESHINSVRIDREKGVVLGYNTFVRATLSPMRFVFLEQLWFEIIDYFFEGVLGAAVWGGRPSSPASRNTDGLPEGELDTHQDYLIYLPGSDAEGFNFTRFDVSIDSPAVLLPVTYRSTQCMRLQLKSIHLSNRYDSRILLNSEPSPGQGRLADRMQWYNNCDVCLNDLRIFSWCGQELGKDAVVADIFLNWPVGPTARLVVPKWKVDCRLNSLDISLRRSDYALLQNIISHNIGEVSRYLDEWEALQNLSPEATERYQERIMVHFGYDNKDVAPSTYDLTVVVPSLSFSLIEEDRDVENTLAVARCIDLVWQLGKLSDRVTRQKATCVVDLETPNPVSGFDKMLSLSKYDSEQLSTSEGTEDSDEGVPLLAYTSTTRPSGDNIKTLDIVGACIYMVVPAWRRFSSFFQALPEPQILSEHDVGASIQVGDRWYKIGGTCFGDIENIDSSANKRRQLSWVSLYSLSDTVVGSRRKSQSTTIRYTPSSQLRVLLTSPRIILSSIPVDGTVTCLILRMHHLDYLQINNGEERKLSRSFFLHDVEVYTTPNENSSQQNMHHRDNSLIHPWCVSGVVERCNGVGIGDCEAHSLRISADVLEARAAYSDMAIAIDVCLSVFHLSQEDNSHQSGYASASHLSTESFSDSSIKTATATVSSADSSSDIVFCETPIKSVFDIECDGFELLVVDDSGRHFAGIQDLIILSLGKVRFSREDAQSHPDEGAVQKVEKTSSMKLRLHSLDLFDCLQPEKSPFRLAASSRSGATRLQTVRYSMTVPEDSAIITPALKRRGMVWTKFSMKADEKWGFGPSSCLVERIQQLASQRIYHGRDSVEEPMDVSSTESREAHRKGGPPELIELHFFSCGGVSQDYHIKLRSLALQWNPSTVIAIQRFLGRLRKESKNKAVRVFHQHLDDMMSPQVPQDSEDRVNNEEEMSSMETGISVKAVVEVDSLTVCLNKEHQHRRLLEVTLAACRLELDSSDEGLRLAGQLGDFNAWDPDNYESKASSDRVTLLQQNRSVLKVAAISEDFSAGNGSTRIPTKRHVFLEVNYRTFKKKPVPAESACAVPAWVQSHVAETGDIDDYLSLSVAALQFTFLRERTEEILDYLSNGLPGKGMGATSRAAKGFLKKRILTKSFLELHVDSPQVLIPQHEAVAAGITLKLGDVNINSWFEKATSPGKFGQVDREKDQAEWWRMLSLRLTGLSGGLYTCESQTGFKSSTATKPIDLEITLRKPTVQGRDMSLRGKLSFVDVTLQYTDYVILRAVARDNFGRKVDTEKWDNVEKAYWMEEERLDGVKQDTPSGLRVDRSGNSAPSGSDVPVAYSSHARFVRYGKRAKKGQAIGGSRSNDSDENAINATSIDATDSTTLDIRFELDGLSLKLRRDGQVEGAAGMDSMPSSFDYDVMLLRVQLVELSVNTNVEGDLSFHLSLFRIGLFDLGDRGRLIRERYLDCLAPKDEGDRRRKRRELRPPCPFSVLVEGYSPSKNSAGSSKTLDDDSDSEPQLVVTVDRCPASSAGSIGPLADSDLPADSKVTVARVVINFLSVNALIRPFQEIAAFLSCSWPTQKVSVESSGKRSSLTGPQLKDAHAQGVKSVPSTSRGFQLKLVAHYPRIFFVADESDPHSRALVLRGLAVVNVSKITSVMGQTHGATSINATSTESPQQVQQLTAVDAQLHSMESYINPDVDDALRFKRRHAEMVGDAVSTSSPAFQYEDTEDNERHSSDALGVALIQPVTTGIQYSEMHRDLFPTHRSLFVNMEPVSTMLSFEDLELIEAVLKRWSSKRSGSTPAGDHREASGTPKFEGGDKRSTSPAFESWEYEVVFHSARLGLGLKMDSGRIIVDSVQNSDYDELIAVGDSMISIDGSELEAKSLADAVKELSVAARPTTILFSSSRPRTCVAERAGDPEEITEEPSEVDYLEKDGARGLLKADGLADSYNVVFRVGVPSGLRLEKSSCGNFAIIKNVLPTFRAATSLDSVDESNAEQIETVNLEDTATRVPRIGAVVVAVEGVQAEELGHQEIIRLLGNLSGEANVGNNMEANADSPDWKGSYSVSFLELDSSLWGNVDIVDISAVGITLSFIDDLKGRDMPLLRGKLSSVEIHVERGLGIEASILDVPTPTVVKLFCDDGDQSVTNLSLARDVIQYLPSDTVITFSAIAMSTLDYYHPRIAVWEPLLEPSRLFLLLERLPSNGATRRPGQLAVEVSDCLLREQHFRRKLPSQSSEPQMVSVNLTDPAVEVLVKALSQWKEWRQSVAENVSEFEEDDDESDEDNGATALDQNRNRNKRFPDESLSLVASTDNVDQALIDSARIVTSANDRMRKTSEAKQLATQRAAQAALVYAQKRGADNSKKGETAKPFLFRNRTGVSIAFIQQGRGISSLDSNNDGLRQPVLGRNLSVVGEYIGLEDYDPASITELPDQEDAKFDMDVLSDQFSGTEVDSSKGTKQVGNRVRNYEGRFPSLTVAIQAVSGVSIDPIDDLQVFKVGSAVRHLCVRKEAGGSFESVDATNYSIPVVWKVELEDNRRILTLSSAVRVVSSGFDTPIEVGVQIGMGIDTAGSSGQHKLRIRAIGVARPGSPFYLPLWLALKLEAVSVYVRPSLEGDALYAWGKSSVLEFGPVLSLNDEPSDSNVDSSDIGKWAWKENFKDLDFIRCDPLTEELFAVWLSCFDSSLRSRISVVSPRRRQDKGKHALSPSEVAEESNEVISVTLDSGLTVRNMLPMDLDWEIAHAVGPSTPFIVDGSSTRQRNIDRNGVPSVLYGNQKQLSSTPALKSGECTEVFACDFKHEHLNARFKGSTDGTWSNWAPLLLPAFNDRVEEMNDEETGRDDSEPVQFPVARQVNVQLTDDCFGAPLTFGVRIIPKMTQPLLDDLSQSSIYGLELIIYAELWIRNLTTLPINFGAPAYQMHESCYNASDAQAFSEQSAARFSAESALMEIASVLEFGDKGTGFSNKTSRELAETGVVESLPKQRCSALVEEGFEYVEMENSTVKRRWWASESYDSYRENITQSPEESETWRWVDETWAIDCTGRVKASEGGWESCRNLLGAGSFSGKREFDPSHKFRRRRWFRTRATDRGFNRGLGYEQASPGRPNQKNEADFLLGGLQAFHQPVKDSFSIEQSKVRQKRKKKRSEGEAGVDVKDIADQDGIIKIAIKSGDGKWSTPATIPPTGTCHGVMRALASRWPTVTKAYSSSSLKEEEAAISANEKELRAQGNTGIPPYQLKKASLSPGLMELCYTVSDIEGDWGDFSRSMVVYPRFLFRNDSETITIEVKQTGSSDETSVTLSPGEVHSFYWADFRLPGLVSVRPASRGETAHSIYRWSGGFDICNLGMVPIRARQTSVEVEKGCDVQEIRSIRALVEIRPGTGGSGINVSFKEEDAHGDGSLFRIENLSPFPIWLAQDGVLANPSAAAVDPLSRAKNSIDNEHQRWTEDHVASDGDLVQPTGRISYALDIPFRQGKYAHRKAATMSELLRLRVALAPLRSRAGIESVKAIGFTLVGDSVRLNPSKLVTIIPKGTRTRLQRVRVLGIITSDGPTRVLKFCLMEYSESDNVFGNPFADVSYISTKGPTQLEGPIASFAKHDYDQDILKGGIATLDKMKLKSLPSEGDAKRYALFGELNDKSLILQDRPDPESTSTQPDQIYSFRAAFSGFVLSLVDSAPSEIAVVSWKNFNVLARWNAMRTTDASVIMSVGWLQVDNHVPSAPFPVAVRPDDHMKEDGTPAGTETTEPGENVSSPLLVVGLAFAPRHTSGIVCLRSVTVAPRNLVIAIDLAFLVRLQKFFVGLMGHFQNRQQDSASGIRAGPALLSIEQKREIPFPDFEQQAKDLERAAAFGVGNQKLYFEGLTILPCNINLSVAPARALTPAQASLEGKEAAAIHQAVRKGDVLVGGSSAMLGVRVGRRNTTALAVVRGIFKSIVVDALLRLDGASLNFAGVFLRNHISTTPQLTTFLLAHYLASLRHNVPALIGSLAAFGNPLGLIRGLGDGVSDFVSEPVKGLKRSVEELNPSFLVDGVARGTESLARHTVGGFADSASLLTETFSKNMAVLTLDRRYAQKRDRGRSLRRDGDMTVTLVGGVESGFIKLLDGFLDGVTGVVKAPMRGAEKRGIEGFAKGIGKGLLGLLVKPIIGISDAATDVMIGVKSTVENNSGAQHAHTSHRNQFRPRRPMYGRDKVLRPYNLEDAAAATLMLRTRNAGDNYLSHMDMDDRVALLSSRRVLLLGPNGQELLSLKFKHVANIEVRSIKQEDGSDGWGIIVLLNTPRRNGSEVEVICCKEHSQAVELCSHIKRGMTLVNNAAL